MTIAHAEPMAMVCAHANGNAMQRAWVAIAHPEPMKMIRTEPTAMPCVEQVAMAQPELMAVARGVPMASACTAHAEPTATPHTKLVAMTG
jgi:hypothetical protein